MVVAADLQLLLCAPDGVNASATCIVCSFTAALLLASLARWHLLLHTCHFICLPSALPCILP
jgi:hypothetical protein